jgi:Zn-dependent protease
MPTRQGSFKIFTLFGIGVYVHYLWLVMAVVSWQWRTHAYSSPVWNVAEYLSLFLIVLIHEFGHQLACRSVGGQTHDIVLWFLGGVAYVTPPERPGAQLWSIAAGPLVNVVLIPIFALLVSISSHLEWYDTHLDAYNLLHNVFWINIGLLIFNMVPVYPLDGGQILRSLLWFPFGRVNSLFIASIVGFIGLAGLVVLIALAVFAGDDLANAGWLALIAFFIATNCWRGLKQALALARFAKVPRRAGLACPSCKMAPPLGEFWRCGKCGKPFDLFQTMGVCPHCGTQYGASQCLDCGTSSPVSAWAGDLAKL